MNISDIEKSSEGIISKLKDKLKELHKEKDELGLRYTEIHDSIKVTEGEITLLEQYKLYVDYLVKLVEKHK